MAADLSSFEAFNGSFDALTLALMAEDLQDNPAGAHIAHYTGDTWQRIGKDGSTVRDTFEADTTTQDSVARYAVYRRICKRHDVEPGPFAG